MSTDKKETSFDISDALWELSKFEAKFNVPGSQSLLTMHGEEGIFGTTDDMVFAKVEEYRLMDNKNITYTDIRKSVMSAKEVIDGSQAYNDLTVNLSNGERITVSYQGDNSFLLDHKKADILSFNTSNGDISNKLELKSPGRVADYLWNYDIESLTDFRSSLIQNSSIKSQEVSHESKESRFEKESSVRSDRKSIDAVLREAKEKTIKIQQQRLCEKSYTNDFKSKGR